jgi:hypothetical protein
MRSGHRAPLLDSGAMNTIIALIDLSDTAEAVKVDAFL